VQPFIRTAETKRKILFLSGKEREEYLRQSIPFEVGTLNLLRVLCS